MLLTADHVEQMHLPTTTSREGYEKSSVDAYLEEIVATLRAWETEADGAAPDYVLHSGDVTGAAFPTIPAAHDEGYEEERVDDLLDDVVSTLVHYEARAAAVAGGPGAGGAGARATTSNARLPLYSTALIETSFRRRYGNAPRCARPMVQSMKRSRSESTVLHLFL